MKTAWVVLGIGLLTGCGGSVRLSGNSGGAAGASGSGGAVGTAGTDAGGAPSSGGTSATGGASGSGGTSGSGGVPGSGGAPEDAGKICGTIAGIACAPDEWCDYAPDPYSGVNYCGGNDGGGTCRRRPQGCPADCPGVCGCDGEFYCNACLAHQAGVDDTSSMTCMHGAGDAGASCSGDSDCSSGLKCCYPCGIPGCTMQCMQPESNGQCPLFN